MTSRKGKVSESIFTVRQPWSWYMQESRRWAVKSKQKSDTHVEAWYGFFPSFTIRKDFPDTKLDTQLDADFDELFKAMYDMEKKTPLEAALPHRIQNHALAASVYASKYKISQDMADLEMASALCDFVMKTQKQDGAYRSGNTHYTSVIYVAKAMMEVTLVEQELAKQSPLWKERFERHYQSVQRAIDDLSKHLDNIDTEGEITFEDGMIS